MGKAKKLKKVNLVIGDVLVDKAVFDAFFSCDLHECKGKCCVEGVIRRASCPVIIVPLKKR